MELRRRVWRDAKRILARVTALLLVAGVPASGADDSRLFTTGFEAFSGGDSKKAARTLSHLLEAYPGTKLRELTLFYLARAHFGTGNQEAAAQALARLLQEYPGTSLAAKAEKDLLGLVARYRKGEKLSRGDDDLDVLQVGELAAVSAAPESGTNTLAEEHAVSQKAETERLAREKAEREEAARQKAEAERLTREKAEKERLTREEAERARLAAEQEKAAREKAERERVASERAEREQAARQKAETERLAREKAEKERLAREEAEGALLAMQEAPPVREKTPAKRPPVPSPAASAPPVASGAEISGPLLRAVIKSDKTDLSPGERVEYLVTLLNVGSGRAEGVALRLMFPDGDYEPVDFARNGFRNEGGGALVLDNVSIESGQALEYPVVFRVKNDAGMGQELRCSVRLLSGAIGTWDSYRSKPSFVRSPRRP